MTGIHRTAVIEDGAQIDPSATIGAFSVIGPNVTIGAGTTVGSHTVIEGHTSIGVDNRIAHHAAVGGAPQDMKYAGEPTRLLIGDRNVIREFTTIHTGTTQDGGETTIGNDNWIMAYVHIAHDCHVGNHTVFSSNAQIAGHVVVGDWAILGGMSGVHQSVRIGAHSFLGGASALVQDLPPFVMAAGEKAQPHAINIEGLRRRGFTPGEISALRAAYRTVYKNGLSFEEAKAELNSDLERCEEGQAHLKLFLDFIASTKRGIIR
jgi:UDP-N-acetylglucosamine acyltransferase